MNRYKTKIAITTGDINGIGIEITAKALKSLNLSSDEVVIITSKSHFPELGYGYEIIDIPYNYDIEWGKVTPKTGEYAFQCLKKACEIQPRAIVTAPVSKEGFHLAGHKFNGQTEVLEHFLAHDGQKAEMLFVADGFRVLLLTRHCALKDVPKVITKELITEKVERLYNHFKFNLQIENPKFALCALNPHSGEGGILGDEEELTITPAVEDLRDKGINISNPFPADTLFIKANQHYLKGESIPYDCYIAMYHDQGLIPIKTVAGDKTVNMTIGLDIVRTSPSHGTAFDIAGKNIANPDSMIEAIKSVL